MFRWSICSFIFILAKLSTTAEEDLEDEVLVNKFCKRVIILGSFLHLPTLPEGYLKEFHRKSSSSFFKYEGGYEVGLSQEEHIESSLPSDAAEEATGNNTSKVYTVISFGISNIYYHSYVLIKD